MRSFFPNTFSSQKQRSDHSGKKLKPTPDPAVELRSVWLAPKRRYLELQFKPAFNMQITGRNMASQWIIVLQRAPFAGSWILLLLVGNKFFWEFEQDVKLWKQAQ